MQKVNLVKIGSDSINQQNLTTLLNDMERYEEKTWEKFVIISSWAVKIWREIVKDRWLDDKKFTDSTLASIWQNFLVHTYDKLARWVIVGEILLDDYVNNDYINNIIWKLKQARALRTFAKQVIEIVNAKKDKHLAETISNMVLNWILPVINHNDAMSEQELKNLSHKTDNDKNTIHVSEAVNNYRVELWIRVSRVIFLTNTHWLLDINNDTVRWWLIDLQNIDRCKDVYMQHVNSDTSLAWTWWMWSKVDCSIELLKYWVRESIISNAEKWLECLDGSDNCTKFRI